MAYNKATYIPAVPLQFFTDAGVVAAGYKLFIYAAGTTTKVTTYTNGAATAANANPLTLDAAGRATVFCLPANGVSLKYVLATPTTADPPTGGNIIWTRDDIGVVPNTEANIDVVGVAGATLVAGNIVVTNSAGKWVLSDPAAAATSIDALRLGVVMAGGATNASVVVRVQGQVSISGLVAGTTYYLSDTPGALSSTVPGTTYHRIQFGYANSAGNLLFPINSMFRVGTRLALKSVGYSTGQWNNAGGADTQFLNYDIPVPAGSLDQPGACLLIDGTLSIAANANAKTFKCKFLGGGAPTLVTLWGSSANVANHVIPFRFLAYYRTSTTGSITGIAWHGATHAGAPTNYLVNSAVGTVNWAAGQYLTFYGSGATEGDVKLTDVTVYLIRSYFGVTI